MRKIVHQSLLISLQIIITLLFNFNAQGQTTKYLNWKLNTYPPSKQAYFQDNIAVYDKDNKPFYIDSIQDKPILIVFWASWCTHCVNMINALDILKKDFRKVGLEILAISEDYQGVDVIKKFFQENQIRHLDILYDYKFKLFGELNMSSLPYAFLLDKDKKIVLSFDGSVAWQDDKVRKLLLEYIPDNPIEPKNSYREEFFTTPKKNNPTSLNQENPNNENENK